jgi:type IV pilus assembly protein PilO
MNDLLERFFDLDTRTRILAGVGAALLVIFAYWNFVYAPRRAFVADQRTQIENLVDTRTRKQKLVANLDEERAQVRRLQAELRAAEVRLPDEKEIPDLLSTVSSAGRESGLEILLFKLKPERYQEFYAEVPVEVLVRGNYHQVATFFDKVSRLDRIVNVGDIDIKAPPTPDDRVTVDTSCSAVTFRFLDEAERERIAAEKAAEESKGGKKKTKETGSKAKAPKAPKSKSGKKKA